MSLTSVLYDSKRNPSSELLAILTLLNIEHDGSWDSIVRSTQAAWLRPPKTEAWHLQDRSGYNRSEILQALDKLSCVKSIAPIKTNYTYALILGTIADEMHRRVSYLIEQWNRGIRFQTLAFLGSERPLAPEVEPLELITHPKNYAYLSSSWHFDGSAPATEYQMMKIVFEQTTFPKDFCKHVVFINTPMQQESDGSIRRPNTVDTVKEWVNKESPTGTALFVSTQPFVGYQDCAIRSAVPNSLRVETVGAASNPNEMITLYLDNLARWIYQSKIRNS